MRSEGMSLHDLAVRRAARTRTHDYFLVNFGSQNEHKKRLRAPMPRAFTA
jgi:hypothetical protein